MVILSFIALFYSSVLARKTSHIKPGNRKNQLLKRKINRAIHKFVDKIKLPTAKTSISQPVCSRTFSEESETKASELKKMLLSSEQSQRCSADSFGDSQMQNDTEYEENQIEDHNYRVKRSLYEVDAMTQEEKDARADLAPTGIDINRICVQQVDCVEAGSTDPNTDTINMCRTCKFFVYLPWE